MRWGRKGDLWVDDALVGLGCISALCVAYMGVRLYITLGFLEFLL